ncbi:MAG: amidohydrolase [Candidatus Eisenbacteria bacterium]|nr:amidohydrolase [Candidatus Eisenbacteria bacterium]
MLAAGALILCTGRGMARASRTADLVFRGGPIHTADESIPLAGALAVKNGRIVYVGPEGDVEHWIGKSTRVIDLSGRALIPGFVDADARLLDMGRMSEGLDLYDTRSFEDVLRKVARAARSAPPNSWILGWGWDQESWRDSGSIRLLEFQSSSGNRPVVLFHSTDDVLLANIPAMAAADISEDLPDPPGGRVTRDNRGIRQGDLQGEAASLLMRAMPVPTPAQFESWYAAAAESCLARGVTLAHDLNVPIVARPALESLYRNDKSRPALQLSVSLAPQPLEFDSVIEQPPADGRKTPGLTMNGITLRLDGDVNTRGASITHVYADQQGNRGYTRYQAEELIALVARLNDAGWRLILEAHGDSAVSLALLALGSRGEAGIGQPPILTGLELVRPDQLALLAGSGAAGIMTPTHLIDGWHWMERRIGLESAESAWALGSLVAAGFPLAIGTDAPFAAGNPLLAFYGAVTRQDLRGRPSGGWNESERLSRTAALAAMTLTGARILGHSSETGSLTVGKRADLVVLSGDLMTLPERELPALRVTMTVAGGRIVHEHSPATRN